MGRSLRLRVGSFLACATFAAVLASGCSAKREVLATDHQDQVNQSNFGSPEAGRAPFGVTVWGTGSAASYGYPGGSAIRTLNSVETVIR